jgi:hypothetical protein
MTGKSKAPCLKLTAPEEEWAVFQDQSDLPMDLLIESLKKLDVNPASKDQLIAPPAKNIHRSSGAVKDVKALIKSEWWDEMLCLGSQDCARAGSWGKASQTTHPLAARHLLQVHLRKWARLDKNEKRKKLERVTEAD